MLVLNLPTLLAITVFTSGLAGCLLLLSWLQHSFFFFFFVRISITMVHAVDHNRRFG